MITKYMKLHQFTEENISLLFLSPYVEIQFHGDGVLLRSELFGTSIKLVGERKMLEALIDLLENGATESGLRNFIQAHFHVDAREFMATCMARGIVE